MSDVVNVTITVPEPILVTISEGGGEAGPHSHAHFGETDNPHEVTAAQAGALTEAAGNAAYVLRDASAWAAGDFLKVKSSVGGVLTVERADEPAGGGGAPAIDNPIAVSGGTRRFSVPGAHMVEGSGNFGLAANQVRYMPFTVRGTPITVDRIVIVVTTAAAEETTARLGLYRADGRWQPTDLVVDGGTVAVDSTGSKAVIVATELVPGNYLFAANSDGAPALLTFGVGMPAVLRDNASTSMLSGRFAQSQTYGAFPDPGTAWTSDPASSNVVTYWAALRWEDP